MTEKDKLYADDICEMARALRLGTPLQALEQQPCEDCISREAVLEHICEAKECYKEECKGRTLKRCPDLQWVFDLPPVTPQRPKGKWTLHSDYPDRLICEKCKAQFDMWHWEIKQMHFCPNCGAEMNGGEEV